MIVVSIADVACAIGIGLVVLGYRHAAIVLRDTKPSKRRP